MASLRARLLAGLLGLAAAAMLVLAAVTYVEQRSFLLERVDERVRSAPGAVARALDGEGGPGRRRGHGHRIGPGGGPGGGPRGGGPGVGLPPGTYGQRRASPGGEVLGEVVFAYGQDVRADPALPAELPVGRLLTVDGGEGDDTRYRVLAEPDPFGGGIAVVAVPLRDVDQTLRRLLLVEALVIAGVLLVLGGVA